MNDFGMMIESCMKEMEARITERVFQQMENNASEKAGKMWMTKTELASYLGICFKTLDKFMKEHPNFPSTNFSGAIRFNACQVDEWLVIHNQVLKMRGRKQAS